jgi:hypothetical protein
MANDNILKGGIRIFRPREFRLILSAIPKIDLKDKFESLLYSGCRYNELRWLYKHRDAFDEKGKIIHMISLKPEAKHADRYIRLTSNGARAVTYFLKSKRNLPAHTGWNTNLKRWCEIAGISNEGVCCKSTRRTWETWLATMYPNNFQNILLNQGHTEKIALEYYLMLPYTDEDKKEMAYYTSGWL